MAPTARAAPPPPSWARALEAVQRRPGASAGQVALEVWPHSRNRPGVVRPGFALAAGAILSRLVEAGAVERIDTGGPRTYWLTDKGRAQLVEWRGPLYDGQTPYWAVPPRYLGGA